MKITQVYRFKELPSTNEFAKSLVKEADEWTLVIADKQTDGKGRFGRSWYSPEGGLWFSVILRPKNFLIFPLLAGVAVCEAMKEIEVNARIKWPNDILINGKKVAGILAEFEEGTVVLGVGINLNIQEFPEEIRNTATSLLLETDKTFDKDEVVKLVLEKIEEKHKLLEANKSQELLAEFKAHSITLGKRVTVETTNGLIEGEALDIADDGALLLKLSSGKIEKIFAGECSLKM